MARVYNFSAGPSMLPEAVLKKAAEEMLDYKGSGQSVMEMSHRSASTKRSYIRLRLYSTKSWKFPRTTRFFSFRAERLHSCDGAAQPFQNKRADIVDTGNMVSESDL